MPLRHPADRVHSLPTYSASRYPPTDSLAAGAWRRSLPLHRPLLTHQPFLPAAQMEMENRRAETRARIEASRMQARARVEEQEKHRRALADAMYRQRLSEDRLRVVDPVW